MKVEELRRTEDQRPLPPFAIRTVDGRSITLRHPDARVRDPESPGTALGILEVGGS
jgi:hypothetical protein